jgi:hypothetical protein
LKLSTPCGAGLEGGANLHSHSHSHTRLHGVVLSYINADNSALFTVCNCVRRMVGVRAVGNRPVVSLRPHEVIEFDQFTYSFLKHWVLGFTQLVPENSSRDKQVSEE